MIPYLEKFENHYPHLAGSAGCIVLLATIELAWILVRDAFTPPVFLLEIHELLELFGLLLPVLIGIELMHSVKTYIVRRSFDARRKLHG